LDIESQISFDLLKKRGPDSFQIKIVKLNSDTSLVFAGSVLSLRGSSRAQVTPQPLHDTASGNLLLWNGEIFASDLISVDTNENDGQRLLDELSKTTSSNRNDLISLMGSVRGPYAFVFYDNREKCVFFGRDRLGRRSLLISLSEANKNQSILTLSSVKCKQMIDNEEMAANSEFEELKANGIYMLDLNQTLQNKSLFLCLYEWKKVTFKCLFN
jgi:asparagine synthetase B (glutamine-hydrolysing)